MQLSQWPLSRVLLVCLAWAVIAGAFFIALPLATFFTHMRASGSHGLGSASFGIAETLGPVVLPPLVFLVVWLVVRRA